MPASFAPAPFCCVSCRTKELEDRVAAAEAGCAQMEQQLALARSQLADTRALMDSAQVGWHLGPARQPACGTLASGW